MRKMQKVLATLGLATMMLVPTLSAHAAPAPAPAPEIEFPNDTRVALDAFMDRHMVRALEVF